MSNKNTLIPVTELIRLISELEPPTLPIPDEGTLFRIFWVFKRDGKIILPRGNFQYVVFPVHEFLDCEIVGEIEFRWDKENSQWNLLLKDN